MNELYLTDAYGTKWMFYTSDLNHLCFARGGRNDEILFKNVTSEYDIVLDDYGHFHILTEGANGTLVYIKYDYNEWKKYEILKNKSSAPKISHIKLFMADKVPIAFYALDHGGKRLLAEHKIREGLNTAPMIIDTIGVGCGFSALLDSEKCFHLLYKNELGKAVYKTAPYGAKSFSAEEFLCENDLVRSDISEGEGSIHFVYTANINSYYTVCYYNTKNRMIKSLAFGVNARALPTVSVSNGKIYVRWLDGQRAYECMSESGGDTFSKPANVQRGARLFRVFSGNSSRVCISETPISIQGRTNGRAFQSTFSKPSDTYEIKEKLRKTEAELKNMRELYESLNDKLNHLSDKVDTKITSPKEAKIQQKEKYKFSDIKSQFEGADGDMTDVFNQLTFDDISFDGAFSTARNLPAVINEKTDE